MRIVKTGLIFAAGFLLGVVAFHTRSAIAAQNSVYYVERAETAPGGFQSHTRGSTFDGFSCATNSHGDVECYIATH